MPTAEVVLSRKFEVGQQFTVQQEVTEELIELFAVVSKDRNRLHLDPVYAGQTRFRERIAHGMIGAGLISAALASMGGEEATIVYLSQTLKFYRPVKIGDTLTAVAEIIAVDLEDNIHALTVCRNQSGKIIMDGEAAVMADKYPYQQPQNG